MQALREEDWVKVRGNDIAMIFQDPMTSLDPTMKIGRQIAEPIMFHTKLYQKEDSSSRRKERHHRYRSNQQPDIELIKCKKRGMIVSLRCDCAFFL